MAKEFWINLPVKDLAKSKAFFSALGFAFHPRHLDSEHMAGLVVGDKGVLVMLFPESTFKAFTKSEVADPSQAAEVLFSIDASSKAQVEEIVNKAVQAGGTVYSMPQGQGGMYGACFADVDGHRWNVLYMQPDLDAQ
ncbi:MULTISPECIES: VOC family protein [Paenibacillus]|uniref:VOC family protein n=1 Tax=Paenibacillus TaxID=44249 RepID=UPI0022B926EF|nr:VOC family protein [Paenibacillus caseinilyticus]MCZ8518280.1 extradiol dioxygenase [Paenibacillus caseinilyticus]